MRLSPSDLPLMAVPYLVALRPDDVAPDQTRDGEFPKPERKARTPLPTPTFRYLPSVYIFHMQRERTDAAASARSASGDALRLSREGVSWCSKYSGESGSCRVPAAGRSPSGATWADRHCGSLARGELATTSYRHDESLRVADELVQLRCGA